MSMSIEERVAWLEQELQETRDENVRLREDVDAVANGHAQLLVTVRDLDIDLGRVERDLTAALMAEVGKMVRRSLRIEAMLAGHLALGLDTELLREIGGRLERDAGRTL